MTTTPHGQVPLDFALVLPAGWWCIPLDDDRARERSVAALVDRQFAGVDDQPILHRRTREELLGVAEAALTDGGIRLWLSTQVLAGIPVAASLLARAVPDLSPPDLIPHDLGPPGAEPAELARTRRRLADLELTLRRCGDPGGADLVTPEVDRLGTRAGQAVTRRRLVRPGRESLGATLPSTQLEVWLPVPGTTGWLTLVFSTPFQDELADALVDLFAVLTETFRWTHAGGGEEPDDARDPEPRGTRPRPGRTDQHVATR